MIQEKLSVLPDTLPDYHPFPPAQERAAWEALPQRVKDRFHQTAEAELAKPIEPLPLSLWLDFIRTGRRTPWEDAYFSRRSRLCALVCAECVEHQGHCMDAIAETVWAICEESAWQLPAHNSYIRDTPQLPLPDTSRPIVELFAAETGELLALTRYLLKTELDAAAPGIISRMERELEHRILMPYFKDHFWWMGNGDEPMCNWTSWCTQNVLLTVFLLPTTQEQRAAAVKQAAYSLDCFLKDYGEDGCCNEGAQYYRHAGLTLWGCLELLSAAAPEAFRPLFQEPKIRNIAEYILNVHVDGPYYLNFGDCSPLAGRCGAREYRFGQAVGSDALCALAAEDFRADDDPDRLTNQDGSSRINLWYRLITAFAEQELWSCTLKQPEHSTVWYPSVGVYAAREGRWVLGAKMGSNGDSHNHNDTGSITVYKDGKPFLIDIGVESYTQKTFSPRRYEIWTMQSQWHNLPTFDGVQQLPGAEYTAKDVITTDYSITAELAGAYPPIKGLRSYRRSVLVDEDGITLQDMTDWKGTVELTLLTEQEPTPVWNGFAVGTLGGIRFDPEHVQAEVTPVSVTDPRLRTAWPEKIYKITLHFKKNLYLELYDEGEE